MRLQDLIVLGDRAGTRDQMAVFVQKAFQLPM
jgi:hypothetical protein